MKSHVKVFITKGHVAIHTKLLFSLYTVPLNYNFILTRVDTRGNTQYFACKIPKFPVEIIISTRRDVAFIRTRNLIMFTRVRRSVQLFCIM